MADAGELEIRVRPKKGTGAARAVRRTGDVPGILYGGKEEPMLISVNDRAIRQAIHTPNFFSKPVHLKLDGKKLQALPREVQFHPVTEAPVHVDFLRVSADSKIRIKVPARFVNEAASPGLKRGGVLNVVRHEIEVVCSVAAIPDYFEFDLTGLDIGDSVHISRLALPPGVRLTITDRDFTVASVAAPTVQAIEEEKPAEAAVAAEGAAALVPTTEQGPPPEAAEASAKEGKEKKEKK